MINLRSSALPSVMAKDHEGSRPELGERRHSQILKLRAGGGRGKYQVAEGSLETCMIRSSALFLARTQPEHSLVRHLRDTAKHEILALPAILHRGRWPIRRDSEGSEAERCVDLLEAAPGGRGHSLGKGVWGWGR
jgi:hypothetical protein